MKPGVAYATEPPPGNPGWILYDPAEPKVPPKDWTKKTRALVRNLVTHSLGDFVMHFWHAVPELQGTPFSWGWHLDVLCDHIQAVIEQQIPLAAGEVRSASMPRTGLARPVAEKNARDLILNVPPGTMKSLILNVFAPAWMWIRNPSWSVICASGNESAALRDSSRCRDLLKSDSYVQLFKPTWTFSADNDGKTKFQNTAGGVRAVRTVGQAVTGDRADALFVDDPNDAQQIRSEAYRKRINEEWWSAAMSNRLNNTNTGVRIIIMQRLHEEDLVGYILDKNKRKSEGGTWEQVVIPMEYEVDPEKPAKKPLPGQDVATFLGWFDPRSYVGELLMPHRFSASYVQAEKTEKGSAGYAGQYQQRPSPKEGNRFKREWWRFWRYDGAPLVQPNRPEGASGVAAVVLPPREEWEDSCESWDLTFKGKDSNDWVVGVKVVKVQARRFIVAARRKHTGFGGAKQMVVEFRAQLPRITGPIVIEDKANGPAVMEDLEKEVPGLIAFNPKDGKEQRAAVMEPQVEAGNWYLPDGEEFNDELMDEFAFFPNGKHDDFVDACSQAAARLNNDSELAEAMVLFGVRDSL